MKTVNCLPFVMVLALAACGQKSASTEATSGTAAAPVVAPAPAVVVVPPAPASAAAAPVATVASAADLAAGEKIYTATCVSCHGAGVLGAPKFADQAAWQPRIAKGKESLYTSALNGVRMMPPRGGNTALKDEDVKAAVDYMVSKAS